MTAIKKLLILLFSGMRYSKFLYLYDLKYLVNLNSGEIHVYRKTKYNCQVSRMRNKKFMSEYDLEKYKETHPRANGCFYCNRENNR